MDLIYYILEIKSLLRSCFKSMFCLGEFEKVLTLFKINCKEFFNLIICTICKITGHVKSL